MSTDVRMDTEQDSATTFPTWDFFIDDSGQALFIENETGDAQAANLCAFIDKSSSPQLPTVHTPWSQYMNGKTEFGDVDMTIRSNLNLLALSYKPTYAIVNDKLT